MNIEEYESIVVTISDFKEELERTNGLLAGIFNVLYDYVYDEDNREIEE